MTKKLRVTVEGKTYDVTVEIMGEEGITVSAPTPVASAPVAAPAAPVAPAPAPAPAAPVAGAGDVPSPLAGKVVSVDVKIGQEVSEGEQLVTLEAMKMNTYVNAPGSGTVKAINVNAGDAVEEGQSLLTLG